MITIKYKKSMLFIKKLLFKQFAFVAEIYLVNSLTFEEACKQ